MYRIFVKYLQDCYREVNARYASDPAKVMQIFKDLNFDYGHVPDYSDPLVQQAYHMRYMYAYAYEYFDLFRRLLTTENLPATINLLSIGCGSGIDYWSAWMAKQKENFQGRILYTGLDLIDWEGKWGQDYMPFQANVHYEQGDAIAYLEKCPYLSQNVFLFPKSISEFSENAFARLCDVFASKNFRFPLKNCFMTTTKVHVLASLRRAEGIAPDELRDQRRCEQLARAMEQNGFCLEDPAKAEICLGEDARIGDRDSTFQYPQNILNFFGQELIPKDDTIRYPILNAKFICNRIMTFVRKGTV